MEVPRKILLELLLELQAEGQEQQDLHIELLKPRHYWMLRKVGSNILDDLSYSTAGSKFKQSGVFEISMADTRTRQRIKRRAPGPA